MKGRKMEKRKRQPDGELYIWAFGIVIGAIGGFGAGGIVTILLFGSGVLAA